MIYIMLKNMKKLLKDKQDADKVVSYIRDGTKDTKLRENTSMKLYQNIQSPKLEKLANKIEDITIPLMYDRMLNQNQLAIEDPYYYQNQLEIEDPSYDQPRSDGFKKPPKQNTFTVDIFKEIDKEVISKYNIPTKYNSKDEIENVLENIRYYKNKNNEQMKIKN